MNPFNDNGIHNTGQTFFHKPSPNSNNSSNNNDICPNPKLDDLTPQASLFHFPSPHIHYEDDAIFLQYFYDLLHQQQPSIDNDSIVETAVNMADSTANIDVAALKRDCKVKKSHSVPEQAPRKRASKKDRHSKINTAHGPRDRRMRLSLDVARKFFDLQDMLEYDKASKTVEWLLTQAKDSIKELARGKPNMMQSCSGNGANSASSTSECEVVSGIIDESAANGSQQAGSAVKRARNSCSKEKKKRAPRKIGFHPLAKESRERARARARERTREKRRLAQSEPCLEAVVDHDLNHLGSWSNFEPVEESGSHGHDKNPSFEVPAEVEERSAHPETREEIVGDSLVITSSWSPSPILNLQQNPGILHEHQFTDFQFYGKAWETYNNMNL